MKKFNYLIALFLFINISFISCNDDDEIREPLPKTIDFSTVQVQDFIWQGLNFWYLWKANVPQLADNKIDDTQVYFNLLNTYQDPFDSFESLLYDTQNVDIYSWIVDDYVELENSFQGIIRSNGVKYQLSYETGSQTELLGYVKYVLPNSDASEKDVKRGYVFDAIDGIQLNINNYKELLDKVTYTMNFADLNGGNPISNGKSVELTQVDNFIENPVYMAKTLEVEATKIGYLMYNGFDSGFEEELDNAFAQLKADGATELVLDLRYNLGGYGYLALQLASSITGQFYNEILKKDVYNQEIQDYFEKNDPDALVDRFVKNVINIQGSELRSSINSLNLNTLYVLTSGSTASASEVVISGLKPHINVVTIGTTTYGKYTGSLTLYDSDNFRKDGDNLNPTHKWAMQPIILKYTNKNNEDVRGGILPDITKIDNVSQFGELGSIDEPLLAIAIEQITGVPAKSNSKNQNNFVKLNEFSTHHSYEYDLINTKVLPFLKRKN